MRQRQKRKVTIKGIVMAHSKLGVIERGKKTKWKADRCNKERKIKE